MSDLDSGSEDPSAENLISTESKDEDADGNRYTRQLSCGELDTEDTIDHAAARPWKPRRLLGSDDKHDGGGSDTQNWRSRDQLGGGDTGGQPWRGRRMPERSSKEESRASDTPNWRARDSLGDDRTASESDTTQQHGSKIQRRGYSRETSVGNGDTRSASQGGGYHRLHSWEDRDSQTTELKRENRYRSATRGEGEGGSARRSYDADAIVIGYKILDIMSKASPSEAIMFCQQLSFTKLLQDQQRSNDWFDLILTLVNNAFNADDTLSGHKKGLKIVLLDNAASFLTTTCTQRFTMGLVPNSFSGTRIDPLIGSLGNYLNIFHHLCAMDPLVSKSLIGSVNMVWMMLKSQLDCKPELKGIYELYGQATTEIERKRIEKEEAAQRLRSLAKTGRAATDKKSVGNFREISVYPTEEDLTAVVELRQHLVSGAFESVEDYLDIQFRLLREDFVSTIRVGIREFKKNPNLKGAGRFRSGDVKVYDDLTILSPNFGRHGLTYTVMLDKSSKMFQNINWASTKRLMFGSLLCLSLDCFEKNNLFATIADRDTLMKDGGFEIEFLPESQEQFDHLVNKAGPFMAVESTAYFLSYLHVLRGMQNMSADSFNLSKYIVSIQKKVSPPDYTRIIDDDYRLITEDHRVTRPVSIFDEYRCWWPSAQELGFNDSQYEAFKMALTKEFVIIQGPPGTGKTFIGLKIVEALLYNLYNVPHADTHKKGIVTGKHLLSLSPEIRSERAKNCRESRLDQMLVVCYTNHALDQFLEGMLSFCPIEDIVRVGSRSKNEALMECNLKNKRGRRSGKLHRAYLENRDRKETFEEIYAIDDLTSAAERAAKTLLPLDTEGLFTHYELIYAQIADYDEQLADDVNVMNAWLQWNVDNDLFETDTSDTTRDSTKVVYTAILESIEVEGEAERELHNRQIDVDDDAFSQHLRRKVETSQQTPEQGIPNVKQDADGFQKVKPSRRTKWKLQKRLSELLGSTDMMTEEEVENIGEQIEAGMYNVTDHDSMSVLDRWRLYRYLVGKYCSLISSGMGNVQREYKELLEIEDELRCQEDIATLTQAKVIGMTTTGAARMQSVLQQVGPDIVVVEEAAEVLEAHIITALSKHCKHLILIGDHKQLKPSPTVYDLAVKFHLDLSLFERMVNNELPVKTLNIQHRMRPEVSKYMRHIYDRLDDHSSVMGRDAVEGVKAPVFFFNHNHPEKSDEMTMSHSNEFEADMVVGLTRYLLRQRTYEPEDITIITMYTGQLLLIKKGMPKIEFQGVKITSVDNFQGEENKIIILSLVRSNKEGKLGFVGVENRVCVSLSRAQYGMYVFGNFDMFAKGSDVWRKMIEEAKKAGEFGSSLNLSCQMHNKSAVIEEPADFRDKAPAGGCTLKCGKELPCGHLCRMQCHSKDLEHKEYNCPEPCTKTLSPCNHPCPLMCHKRCLSCRVPTAKVLACGHSRPVPCHQVHNPDDLDAVLECLESCPETLECGHRCVKRCSEVCTKWCTAKVEQMCSKCSEMKAIKCYIASERLRSDTASPMMDNYQCDTPCDEILACGHKCLGTCYKCDKEGHQKCTRNCTKYLKCGHRCSRPCQDCTNNGICLECTQMCMLKCSHGIQCTKRCSQECLFLVKTDDRACLWGCKHSKCERPCGEPCSIVPCDERCDKILTCSKCQEGYRCVGLCGDVCPMMCSKCDQPKMASTLKHEVHGLTETISEATKWISLVDCQHLVPALYMNKLVYSTEAHTVVRCPYNNCQHPILNTPRYASRTRPHKDAAEARHMTLWAKETSTSSSQKAKAQSALQSLPAHSVGNNKKLSPSSTTQEPVLPPAHDPQQPQNNLVSASPKPRRRRRYSAAPPPLPNWARLGLARNSKNSSNIFSRDIPPLQDWLLSPVGKDAFSDALNSLSPELGGCEIEDDMGVMGNQMTSIDTEDD